MSETEGNDLPTALRRARADMLGTGDEPLYHACHAAAAELDRLRAENEALRAEALRYRWLRDEATEGEWQELSRMPGGITESMIDQWMTPVPHSK